MKIKVFLIGCVILELNLNKELSVFLEDLKYDIWGGLVWNVGRWFICFVFKFVLFRSKFNVS